MKTLILQRQPSTDKGMLGELLRAGKHLCFTIERPWLHNQRNVSAIPAGEYLALKRFSIKFGKHWHLQDVPGRTLILIHIANTMDDLEGCIGVGNAISEIRGLKAVLYSRDTMNRLRALLPDEFILDVRNAAPPKLKLTQNFSTQP